MSKSDESEQRQVLAKGQDKRVGTSVLAAAASLLGTSLGISAATPAGPIPVAAGLAALAASSNIAQAQVIKTPTVKAPKVKVNPPKVKSRHACKGQTSRRG